MLWEKDNILIVGHEKAGKSILAMQLGFAISSGQPLFGEYKVDRPRNVLYVQTEGKLPQSVERAKEMLKVNDCDARKFYIAYYPHLALDTPGGMEVFRLHMDHVKFRPEVIIIDPLYHAMKGSLTDEHSARCMTSNLREIMERYNSAIVLVHHTHKPIRTKDGKLIDEADGAIFGSFVWKAWADHTFLLRVDKTKLRLFSCDTQRSGKVVANEELKLISGPYLAFDRKKDESSSYEISVKACLEDSRGDGVTREVLVEKTGFSISSIEKNLRRMIEMGEVLKDQRSRPVKYWMKAHRPEEAPRSGVIVDSLHSAVNPGN